MIFGIDVGLTGAVAVLTDAGQAVEVFDLPVMANGKQASRVKQQVNAGQLARMLTNRLRDLPGEGLAFIEAQSARPGQGVSSVFSLGASFGAVCAVCACIGLPFLLVTASSWKRRSQLQGANKDVARAMAIQAYPSMAASLSRKKDHNRAEALLLARYGFWTHGTPLEEVS